MCFSVLFCFSPGTITGNSQTGFSNPTDFLPRYLKSVLELKAYVNESAGQFELTPVDITSAIIVDLSLATEHTAGLTRREQQQSSSKSKAADGANVIVFHVCNHNSNLISWAVMGSYAAKSLPSTQLVAMEHPVWLQHFVQHKSNSLYPLLGFVQDARFWRSVSLDTSVTNTLQVWNAWQKQKKSSLLFSSSGGGAAAGVGGSSSGGSATVSDTKSGGGGGGDSQQLFDPFPAIDERLIAVYMRRLISPVALIRQGSVDH